MEIELNTVFLVDDDAAVRKSLSRALRKRGLTVEIFNSGTSFLDNYKVTQPGCLMLDLSMPGINGLELQSELISRGISIPIIFITGHGDIPQSVQALKAGAVDFLEKPLRMDNLFQRIEEAFAIDRELREKKRLEAIIVSRFKRLTNRETEVMLILISQAAALSSKEIARILGISHRTVELHRTRVMEKTQARSISELVDLARRAGYLSSKID